MLFGRRVDRNGNARRRVNLNGLLRRRDGTQPIPERSVGCSVRCARNASASPPRPACVRPPISLSCFVGIDAPVGGRRRDHRLNVVGGSIVRHRRRFEARAGRRRIRRCRSCDQAACRPDSSARLCRRGRRSSRAHRVRPRLPRANVRRACRALSRQGRRPPHPP